MISTALTWKIYAYISSAWTDISSDVLIAGKAINANWGIRGNSEVERMADTGVLSFSLNNATGKYSPNLAGALAGWKKGIPIKLVLTFENQDYVRFRGKVESVNIDAGTSKQRQVSVTVTDWLDYAAEYPLVQPSVDTDKRADEAINTIVTAMPIQPQATSYDTGDNVFPVVFNTVTDKTRAYSEISKLVLSEMGYCYLKKDKTYGETLVFESETHRSGLHDLAMVPVHSEEADSLLTEGGDVILLESGDFLQMDQQETVLMEDTMTDLDVEYGGNLINTMQFTAYPKKVDAAATTVLFKLNQPILLASGETQTLTARYTDPSGGGRKVNGMDMVTPAATTDYLFNTLQNGTGSNITANLTVTASYGAEGVTYTLTNGYSAQGYITKLQARGKGIYNYNSISYTAENDASCNEHGVISKNINQPYQVTLAQGTLKAESIVMREKQPRTILDTVYFTANNSNKLMNAFLNIDVGDLVEIKESQTGIDGQYWVNGIEFGIVGGKVVEVRWYVKEQITVGSGITLMACEFSPAGTVDALQYGLIPEADNLTQRTLSAWVYAHSVPGSWSGHIFGAWSGDFFGYDIAANNGTCVHFQYVGLNTAGSTDFGFWTTPVNSLPLNSWTHIAATRDISTDRTTDPVIYIGGTAQVLTESLSPAGGTTIEAGYRYILGNMYTFTYEYNRPFDGLIKDARIYNRVLAEAEVQSLVAGGTVTDGLLFQAPAVYDTDVADFTDKTLAETDKVIEGITSRVGKPHGSPITRAIT